MKFVLAALLSLLALPLWAQTAEQVQPGTLQIVSGRAKFVPLSSTNPLPVGVYGGTSGYCLTSNGSASPATFQSCGGAGGVTSFSGDGTLISNSGSTGAVTAALANAAANTVWGNNTSGSAAPGYQTSLAISGTATAAGIIPTSSTATGNRLYLPGSNAPAISANGIEVMQFNTLSSGVDYLSITPGKSGTVVTLAVAGATTNQSLNLTSKGTGDIQVNGVRVGLYIGGPVNVAQLGAVCDAGVTDNTAIFTAAYAASSAGIIVPSCAANTWYGVSNLTILSGSKTFGESTPYYSTVVAGSKIGPYSSATVILNVNGASNASFEDIDIYAGGSNFASPSFTSAVKCFSNGSTQMTLKNVGVHYCGNGGVGDSSAVTNTLQSFGSVFYGNGQNNSTAGLTNLVDSALVGGFVAANYNGVYLPTGANDNNFDSVKFEFNTQWGINCYQSTHDTVTGGVSDRNYNGGIRWSGCTDFNVNGGMYRRNGKTNTYGNNVDFWSDGSNTDINIANVNTATGADDGGGGTTSPAYVLGFNDSSDVRFNASGNNFHGYVTNPILYNGTPTASIITNNISASPTVVDTTAGRTQSGTFALTGSSTGSVTQAAQAVAGTPTITWGTSTGTPAVTASSPLAITSATGNITCPTCATTAGGNIPTIAQGDILYGSAANTLSALNKDTNSTRYLSNTGTSNNPSWAQVAVSTGISGFGTGVATALAVNIGGAGAVVLFNGAGGTPASIVLTNATGTAASLTAGTASAVAVGGITGLGTNVATALAVNVGSAGAFVTFNGPGGTPSSMTATNLTGTATALNIGGNAATATSATSSTTATNATNTAITDDTSTNATMDITWVTSNTGNLPQKVTSTKLTFNPSTGVLSSTSFTGAGTGLTGTGASFTSGAVTTNANLTGPITSSGNATSIASQTGTGTTFAMSASPAFTGTVGAAAITATSTVTGLTFVPTGSSAPTNGMYLSAANTLDFATNSAKALEINSGKDLLGQHDIVAPDGRYFYWSSGPTMNGAAAGITVTFDDNNADGKGGVVKAATLLSGGTKFTLSGSSSSSTLGGAAIGSFVSGVTGVGTWSITFRGADGFAATNGWHCNCRDVTTVPALFTGLCAETATGSTTAQTISATTVTNDVIKFDCWPY